MLTLNLLPQKEKDFLQFKKKEAFLIDSLISLIWPILIVIIFLLFGIYFLKANLDTLSKQIALQKKTFEKKEYKDLEENVKKFNEFLIFLDKVQNERSHFSNELLQLSSLVPSKIKLSDFSLDKNNQIFLKGWAEKRSDFLSFKEGLEKSGFYKKIDSPISNIAQKENINFELIIEDRN